MSTATRRVPSPTPRRALLEELALDGPAWRTLASMAVERSEYFVARVEELGLEGVVAKRLRSTYLPGRRCTSWVKNKLRREERLAVTGIRRTRAGHVEATFVARPQPDGSFTGAGAVELGLRHELMEQLERRLAELPARRRGSVAWYPAEVSVIASLHGLADGPVRDASCARSFSRRAEAPPTPVVQQQRVRGLHDRLLQRPELAV